MNSQELAEQFLSQIGCQSSVTDSQWATDTRNLFIDVMNAVEQETRSEEQKRQQGRTLRLHRQLYATEARLDKALDILSQFSALQTPVIILQQ